MNWKIIIPHHTSLFQLIFSVSSASALSFANKLSHPFPFVTFPRSQHQFFLSSFSAIIDLSPTFFLSPISKHLYSFYQCQSHCWNQLLQLDSFFMLFKAKNLRRGSSHHLGKWRTYLSGLQDVLMFHALNWSKCWIERLSNWIRSRNYHVSTERWFFWWLWWHWEGLTGAPCVSGCPFICNNMPIPEYIITLVCNEPIAVPLLNDGRNLKLVLEKNLEPDFSDSEAREYRNYFELLVFCFPAGWRALYSIGMTAEWRR